MKPKTEPSLQDLAKEIEILKRRKEQKIKLTASTSERNKLLMEIKQLDEVQKSPSALKSFGKTFGRGLKLTGQTLWKGISRASRNLDSNAPEIKKFAQTMTSQPKPVAYQKPMKRKVIKKLVKKAVKKKVVKKLIRRKVRKMVHNQPKKVKHAWEFD